MDRVRNKIVEAFVSGSVRRLILSDATDKGTEAIRKIAIRPVVIKGDALYQFTYHYERKAVHENLSAPDAAEKAYRLLTESFRQGLVTRADGELRLTRDAGGKVKMREAAALPICKPDSEPSAESAHNRTRNYLLPEGEPCAFLIRLGVMTESGKVIAAKYDKFRQINRFIEMVADVADALPSEDILRIVDFGCGKSYLTFALHYYFTVRLKREVKIVGLDIKADVVAHCNAVAREIGCEGLKFLVGDIAGYNGFARADMVVSLHACDTATDDALAKAVGWGAEVILSVPCCQKELYPQLANPLMRPLLKHGLFRERLASLITDAARAQMLERAGYAVQALEFIALEHTPKNVLLRAVRRSGRDAIAARRREEYEAFRDFWNIRPAIERGLSEWVNDAD